MNAPDARHLPVSLTKPSGRVPPETEAEVGSFRHGTPLSQWALARYLVGRALAQSVGIGMVWVAAALAVLAVICQVVLHAPVLTAVVVILLIGVLVLRALLVWLVRRLTGRRFGPLEQRVTVLVRDTRGAVLRELRRCGLPGHTWSLPLLGFRLISRRRRAETLARLRTFDTARAVPPARLDELHLVVQGAASSAGDRIVPPW
jgi:hypothetical protein